MSMPIDLEAWVVERLRPRSEKFDWSIRLLEPGVVQVLGPDDAGVLFVLEPTLAENRVEKACILVGDAHAESAAEGFADALPFAASPSRTQRAALVGLELSKLRLSQTDQETGIRRREYEIAQLIEIGKALSAVRDVDVLLNTILAKARLLVGADAGSIYVVEGNAEEIGERSLRFKFSQNDSLAYKSAEFVMPITASSIAGASAILRKTINIPDVRTIPHEAPYQYDASWDEKTGYRTRSVLAVPMVNLKDEVLGVVQLINGKRNPAAVLKRLEDFDRYVVPMDERCQELVETFASQAGVAMENALLYREIQNIFDGFVRASVHAIEQRDPSTSGHSFRVAALTRRLAEVVSDETTGKFAAVKFGKETFAEIETAALLHDFGKVGVREEVLVKAKKLYPPSQKMIRSRFDFIRRSIENDHLHRRLMMVEEGAENAELEILDQASRRAVEEIEECWRVICAANEPTVLPAGDFAKIEEIAAHSYFDLGGKRQPFLEHEEVRALQIAKGSLTENELDEIRSHVVHSISFLNKIPWGRTMRNIPSFAGAHHEKLDGSGYPSGMRAEQIPLPSQMMAVADIYDALTAADRPYKKAVPVERALDILELEVKDHHLDPELVRLFRVHEVFKIIDSASPNGNSLKRDGAGQGKAD